MMDTVWDTVSGSYWDTDASACWAVSFINRNPWSSFRSNSALAILNEDNTTIWNWFSSYLHDSSERYPQMKNQAHRILWHNTVNRYMLYINLSIYDVIA